ncbi:RidA family protein [Pseudomonas protegens]|uniref:RidA family protein n=1 Tax=Pseudomonas protegens TaxID=380021 RepID=UPI001B3366A9|nr:RidA family protein [Pseudomonas protegens]MBP5106754.1 RidA family protein [Pseudomonas protegens]MBP5130138.1 RidA family protein [Pseudomonas protegens]MBP5144505.1 RidA family protein [Pseudomonas protegens]
MRDSLQQRVQQLGLELPIPGQPIANYVNHAQSQNLLFISGQTPQAEQHPHLLGRLGDNLSIEQGAQAAELAALALLAQLSAALGDDLSRLQRISRLGVFIAASADFKGHGQVANGASNLLVNALGEKGRHARTSAGVASLPAGVAVEVDGIFELKP